MFFTQDEIIAGAINCNGTITVETKRAGGDLVMYDFVRVVEEAQTSGAPVQWLADKILLTFTSSELND
uniref:Uncharacterized protein n=1 Tax=Physcomitrium patens TaxID=3218 RepID=A0A2K1IYH5_PHYPA|nr:hypothetical protein PHYPA_024146 [Physcomitrium patens]